MFELAPRPEGPLPLMISECLLGSEVRYDGSGARSSMPHAELAGLYQFQGLCPEMGIGMGTPRPPIALYDDDGGVRALGVKDKSTDVTQALKNFAVEQVPNVQAAAGYVFMKNSPSCGLTRVKLYPRLDGTAPPSRSGRGIYAAAITGALPNLPVEDSGRLFDPELRENFVMRTFAFAHWQAFEAQWEPRQGDGVNAPTRAGLIAFHSRYKYLLMAHSVPHYQQTGRLLSDLSGDTAHIAAEYLTLLMQGLSRAASRGSHGNVMSHLQGYLKRDLEAPARQELAALIDAYQRGEQPLLAPMALLQHHLRAQGNEYLLYQTYLEPHPPAAGLRRLL